MAQPVQDFEASQSEIVQQLTAQLDEKDRILESYKQNHGNLEILFSSLLAHIQAIKPKASVYIPKEQHSTTPVISVMQDTDWHIGATQEPMEIEDFNEYNLKIAESRIKDLTHRQNRWIDRNRLSYDICECVLIVTGDMISGDIHQELQITNEFPATVQVVQAARLLAERISVLAQNFSMVTVHFIGADNHGRLTKKPQAKQEGLNSFNYLVGVLTEAYLEKIVNVNFNLYPQHEKVITIGNRNYLITHGHGIRAWMGIPWYSIERRVGREAQARLQLIMDQKLQMSDIGFHKFVFGHFHTPIDTVMYSCAGSLQGTDAYDHSNGRYAEPSQPGWLVHPRYAEFGRVDFVL